MTTTPGALQGEGRGRPYPSTVTLPSILLQTPIFRDLAPDDVAELLPHLHERRFARGEPVWLEGARSEELYIVAEGQLKSYRVSADGTEVILRLHPVGDVVGEVGLFHPTGARQVNVGAMVASRCLLLRREPLLEFLARHSAAMRRMLEQLSVIAVQVAYAFSGVAFDDIRSRVAATLLTLGREFGEPVGDGLRVRLLLSQGTLGALVAASRENVNRALQGFIGTGVVSQREGHFYLHDLPALERVASVGPNL